MAPIVKRISYGSPISLNERADLALFVALMKFRVSGYRVWAEDYARGNEEDIRSRAFPTPDALREDLRKHGHPEAEDLETVEKVFRDIHSGAYEMQLTKNHMILRMFEITNRVSSLLLRQDWIFAWTTRDDASFATSDDPFLILDRDLKAPAAFLGRVGVASSEATKALPLSQDVCLLIGGSTVPGISHARLERREVRRLNQEQTRHYERWLIARDEALVRRLVE